MESETEKKTPPTHQNRINSTSAPTPTRTHFDLGRDRDGDFNGTEPSVTHRSMAPGEYQVDGAFDGSFGGIAGPQRDVQWYRNKEYYTGGWSDASIWRASVVEFFGTAFLVYISGQFGISLMSSGVTFVMGYVGIFNAVFLAIFIYATIPGSGGHLNPLITFTTFLCGLCPASRALPYLCAQTLGGVLAGGLLVGSWGRERAVMYMGGGAFFDPTTITPNQVLVNEIVTSLVMVYLAIGVGLDPRQQLLFGPQFGPVLVGLCLGLVTAATSNIAPGYTGPNMMPARALGLAVARGNFDYHWIYWVGPAIASLIIAPLYVLIPPYHAEQSRIQRQRPRRSPA